MTPRIRAHRILKAMKTYIDLETRDAPAYLVERTGQIGVYENYPGQESEAILVTDTGVELLGSSKRSIAFADMKDVKFPKREKLEIDHLIISTKHGGTFILPVLGRPTERTRDVFEFMRFIMRCISDANKGLPSSAGRVEHTLTTNTDT